MKLGVMSDTHNNIPIIKRAVSLFNAIGVSLVVHAGDFRSPCAIEPLTQLECVVVGVFGNNDLRRERDLTESFKGIGKVVPSSCKHASVTHKTETLRLRTILMSLPPLPKVVPTTSSFMDIPTGLTIKSIRIPVAKKMKRSYLIQEQQEVGEQGVARQPLWTWIHYFQGNSRFWNPNPLGLGGKTALLERTKAFIFP